MRLWPGRAAASHDGRSIDTLWAAVLSRVAADVVGAPGQDRARANPDGANDGAGRSGLRDVENGGELPNRVGVQRGRRDWRAGTRIARGHDVEGEALIRAQAHPGHAELRAA